MNACFSEEMVVENSHDAVQEFFERYGKNTPSENVSSPNTRYAQPKSDKVHVVHARSSSVPTTTQNDTLYCLKTWKEWAVQRNECDNISQIAPEVPLLTDLESLAYWLERFVLEERMKDRSVYHPNTLHHLICGIQREVRNSNAGIDLFKDPPFANAKKTLDSEMKRISKLGNGSNKRQAEPLTDDDEEKMWNEGLLGDHSPMALVNTIFYMCGIYFALRSGGEHRSLRLHPSQISVQKMISTMCSKAVISGYKTNHSLRATSATRLYHQGVNKQVIME